MAENIVIKHEVRESLFFLTLKLIFLEFFFGLFFLFSTAILDFFELNSQDPLGNVFSLESLLMLSVVVLQIILTIGVVLSWLYSYYELSTEQVTQHRGIIRLKKKSLYFREVQEISLQQGLMGRIFNFGDLGLVGSNTKTLFSLQRISHPKKHIELLQKLMANVRTE